MFINIRTWFNQLAQVRFKWMSWSGHLDECGVLFLDLLSDSERIEIYDLDSDVPDESQERDYIFLTHEIEQKLAALRREHNVPLTNPNPAPDTAGIVAVGMGL